MQPPNTRAPSFYGLSRIKNAEFAACPTRLPSINGGPRRNAPLTTVVVTGIWTILAGSLHQVTKARLEVRGAALE